MTRPRKNVKKTENIHFRATKAEKDLFEEVTRRYRCSFVELMFQGVENLKKKGGYRMTLDEIKLEKDRMLQEWRETRQKELEEEVQEAFEQEYEEYKEEELNKEKERLWSEFDENKDDDLQYENYVCREIEEYEVYLNDKYSDEEEEYMEKNLTYIETTMEREEERYSEWLDEQFSDEEEQAEAYMEETS